MGYALVAAVAFVVGVVISALLVRSAKNPQLSDKSKQMAQHDLRHVCLPWYVAEDGRIIAGIGLASIRNVGRGTAGSLVTSFEIHRNLEIGMDGSTINKEGETLATVNLLTEK